VEGGSGGDFRCRGLCNTSAAVPDSTGPEPNGAWGFGGDQEGQGFCFQTCSLEQGCGIEGLGCTRFQSERGQAACFPINPENEVGDPCNAEAFFDCEENAVCVGVGGRRGVCRQACRPFAFGPTSNGRSDCDTGHCGPLSDSFGVCRQDNMFSEDERCNPPNSMCGEDAVQCFPVGEPGQGNQCFRLCRISAGNDDCGPDSFCFRTSQDGDVGACFSQP